MNQLEPFIILNDVEYINLYKRNDLVIILNRIKK